MLHLGNIVNSETIKFTFNTTLNGAPITLAGTPVVKVYKDDLVTDTPLTLATLSVDRASITGLHYLEIDTSDSFFTAGEEYHVILTAGTVGGVSVAGKTLAHFSVRNRSVDVKRVNGALALTGVAQFGVNVVSHSTGALTAAAIASDAFTAAKFASDVTTEFQSGLATAAALTTVDTVVDAIKATTDKLDTALELDGAVYRYTTNALEQSPAGTAPTAAEIRAEIDSNSTQLAAIVADTSELQTDWANGGRLDLILDARASQTSVDTIDGIVDNILLDTAEIGAAGAGLTAVPWNAAWDAEVQSEVADALGVYDPPTNAEMEARTLAAASYATATNLATVDTVVDAIKAVTDLLPDAGALTSLATAAALATVDANVDAILEDTGTTLPATLSTIAGYIDTEIATLDTVVDAIKLTTDKLDDTLEDDAGTYRFTTNALEQAPSGGSGTADWTDDEKTAIRAILGIPASGTTPADPSTGILDTIRDAVGVVDGVVDAILVDTGTTLDGKLDTIDSNVDAILEDTGTTLPATLADLPTTAEFEARTLVAADYFVVSDYTAPPSAATISTQVTADLATAHGAGSWATATGFAVAGDAMALTSGERNSVADAILSRDVSNVEDTAGDHSLCYVVLAASEWSVSSTTLTVKKTDGSTTFATKTLTKTAGDDPVRGVD